MRKNNKFLLIAMSFLIYNNIYGQKEHTVDMYPKTPDAAAASKFADIPAGNYTGVADFSIPIYTINTKGGSIPISLQYTTTGVKVGEIASRVGLGWSLNTGPSLSQQVIGRIDNIERFKKPILSSVFDIPDGCPPSIYISDVEKRACEIAISASGIGPLPVEGKPDLKPDIFSYSLLSGGGQFIMDYNGEKGIPRPYNSTKIRSLHPWGYIDGIEITDEKGIIYTFKNQIFELQYYNSCMNSTIPIDTDDTPNYKLTNIQVPNQQLITYTFGKSTSSKYLTSVSEQKNIYNKLSSGGNADYLTQPITNCKNTTYSTDKALTEIDFNDGKVLFYYNNDNPIGFTENIRQDLRGDVYLTRVIVKDKTNHTIKDISLKYDYFRSPNDHAENYPDAVSDYPDTFKRLKLTGVKDNLSSGEYNLSYYENYEGKTLPNRLSYSQDFWGVYNGQPNSTGISTVKAEDWGNVEKIYLGGNKEPDINYGVIGNLQKIQYPNGGYTEITYEADDYIKSSRVPPIYKYIAGTGGKVDEPNSIEFTIPANVFNRQVIFFDPSEPVPTIPPRPWTGTGCEWKLYKKNGNNYPSIPHASGHGTGLVDRLENDIPGTYKLSVSMSTSGSAKNDEEKCSAEYVWLNEVIVDNSNNRKTGTIRVHKIESNSEDHGKIKRGFTYRDPNNCTSSIDPTTCKSSGKNAGEELFVSLASDEVAVGTPLGAWGNGRYATQLNRINNPGWQTTTVRGKAIGYDYVQEIYECSLNPSQNYKKQYKFKNEVNNDQPYDYKSTVNISWPTLSLDRGLLEEEKLFSSNGQIIRWTQNEYENDTYFNQFISMAPSETSEEIIAKGLEIKMYNYDVPPGGGKFYHFRKNEFLISNIWIKNIKTTTTDYVNNVPTLVTEQTSAYSTSTQNRHTFPIEQKSEVVGSGISSSQHYQYALEKGNEYLRNKNMISIPLVTESKKTINGLTKTLSKTETKYPETIEQAKTRIVNNTNNKDIPLPYDVFSNDLKTPSATTLEATYDKYDTDGNLLQYTTKSGISTAIIWGYNNTQPIAKVEGATYDQANSIASTIITASNTDASQAPNTNESVLLTALDAFRKDGTMTNYQITTYTYDPLVGVRSVTPPNGIRENYIYDTAGRLKEVRDINGRILKENKYNYKQ